ncbi:MAG: amidase [Rubrivivax sp.]
MAHEDLCQSTIAELGRRLRAAEISPVELAQAYLERIQGLDGQLHTYITVSADRALNDARAAQQRFQQGRPLGPLDGIPLAHKDMIFTQGIRTTCASKAMADHVPARDAAAVARLRAAGAVLLGKLNMHEFASVGPSAHFGRVANPWSAAHGAGGSSSGSAAAVAAGLCAGSLGTDTAGSIRIPAAFCGVVGLKPTHGPVSLDGVVPLSSVLDHVGPITRSVVDAALLLDAVADAPAAGGQSALPGDIRGRTIGVPRAFFDDWIDPEVKQSFDAALASFANLGATIVEVELPRLELDLAADRCAADPARGLPLARATAAGAGRRLRRTRAPAPRKRPRAQRDRLREGAAGARPPAAGAARRLRAGGRAGDAGATGSHAAADAADRQRQRPRAAAVAGRHRPHRAVQHHGSTSVDAALRLHGGRPSRRAATRRQAV